MVLICIIKGIVIIVQKGKEVDWVKVLQGPCIFSEMLSVLIQDHLL